MTQVPASGSWSKSGILVVEGPECPTKEKADNLCHLRCGLADEFAPTSGHRVCSLHFEGAKKTYMNDTPTIFPLKPSDATTARPTRLRKVQPDKSEDQLTAGREEQEMSTKEVPPQFTQSPLPVDDLDSGLSDSAARNNDHTYGLPAEAKDDPTKVLKQQKCTIECLTEREKELEDRVKAQEEEVAKVQLEC
ncbi:THAP domain-containing protein 11-like [Ornithodoros turicata]|uniref:THAP domain-containing protein 11-like n=1 Tax=Ornithodoros turicata TaxID=34597 RepID=UPI00313A484D